MLKIEEQIYTNNNNILTEIVNKLNELVSDFNNDVIIKRIKDIIVLLNIAINENKKNYETIIELLKKLDKKIDNQKKDFLYYPEGIYEGQVINNRREGKGFFYYTEEGKSYNGEWKNDMREGRGIETWEDGDKFEGYFINGQREGRGIYYFHDGDRFEGQYRNGKREGPGIYYYKNGDRKISNYFNDNSVGKVIKIFASGQIQIYEYDNL